MDWLKDYQSLIASLGAACIGAVVALFTNWLQSRRRKSEDAQEWYERHYIFEGVDQLIQALSELNYFFANTRMKLQPPEMKLIAPIEIAERVQTLLNGGTFQPDETDFRDAIKYLYTKVQLIEADDIGGDKLIPWIDATENTLSHLTNLRAQLLEVRILRKRDVYDIYKKSKVTIIAKPLKEEAVKIEKLATPGILKRFPPYNSF